MSNSTEISDYHVQQFANFFNVKFDLGITFDASENKLNSKQKTCNSFPSILQWFENKKFFRPAKFIKCIVFNNTHNKNMISNKQSTIFYTSFNLDIREVSLYVPKQKDIYV